MTIRTWPQYYARGDGDGSWSIVDTQTHRVAAIAETLPLKRLEKPPPNCRDGFTATIGIDLMAVSAQNHPSADSV